MQNAISFISLANLLEMKMVMKSTVDGVGKEKATCFYAIHVLSLSVLDVYKEILVWWNMKEY